MDKMSADGTTREMDAVQAVRPAGQRVRLTGNFMMPQRPDKVDSLSRYTDCRVRSNCSRRFGVDRPALAGVSPAVRIAGLEKAVRTSLPSIRAAPLGPISGGGK